MCERERERDRERERERERDCGISIFSPCGATAQTGPRLPRFEASRSHAIRHARAR